MKPLIENAQHQPKKRKKRKPLRQTEVQKEARQEIEDNDQVVDISLESVPVPLLSSEVDIFSEEDIFSVLPQGTSTPIIPPTEPSSPEFTSTLVTRLDSLNTRTHTGLFVFEKSVSRHKSWTEYQQLFLSDEEDDLTGSTAQPSQVQYI